MKPCDLCGLRPGTCLAFREQGAVLACPECAAGDSDGLPDEVTGLDRIDGATVVIDEVQDLWGNVDRTVDLRRTGAVHRPVAGGEQP